MSEDKLANINGEELRKEIEILFEDKERSGTIRHITRRHYVNPWLEVRGSEKLIQ